MCSAELRSTKPYDPRASIVPAKIAALLTLSYVDFREHAGPSVVVIKRCRIRIASGLFSKDGLTGK